MEFLNELVGHNWAKFLNIKLLTTCLREDMFNYSYGTSHFPVDAINDRIVGMCCRIIAC